MSIKSLTPSRSDLSPGFGGRYEIKASGGGVAGFRNSDGEQPLSSARTSRPTIARGRKNGGSIVMFKTREVAVVHSAKCRRTLHSRHVSLYLPSLRSVKRRVGRANEAFCVSIFDSSVCRYK